MASSLVMNQKAGAGDDEAICIRIISAGRAWVSRVGIFSGIFFVTVGLLYGGMTLNSLPIGTAFNMGPGYFPVVLSSILVVLGVVIGTRGLFDGEASHIGSIPWRPLVMISLAIVIFVLGLKRLGLPVTIFLTTLSACASSRQIRSIEAMAIGLGLAVFCTLVFGFGIKLSAPMIGPWLEGRW